MSSEPGPKTTTLGVSIADNITLRSATIVAGAASRHTPGSRRAGTVPPPWVGWSVSQSLPHS